MKGGEEFDEVEKLPQLAADQAAQGREADAGLLNDQGLTSGEGASYTTLVPQDPASHTAAVQRDLRPGNYYTYPIFHENSPYRTSGASGWHWEPATLRTSSPHRAVAQERPPPAALPSYPPYRATSSRPVPPPTNYFVPERAPITPKKKWGHVVQTLSTGLIPALVGTMFFHNKAADLNATENIVNHILCFLTIYVNVLIAIVAVSERYRLRY